jgi:Arc/MetJ-type ribon-helix-helix transcriptional regulator
MSNSWSHPTTWAEVCQRSNGRRKYHSIRRLQARLRRQQVAQHLRREGLGYGVKAQLARTLGVSNATITSDVRAILAMPAGEAGRPLTQEVRWASETGQEKQPHRAKEDTMSQRCTVRLPDMLYEFLQIEADARQRSTSDLIREALERLLGLAPDDGAKSTTAPESTSLSMAHDCTERLLARLPMDVRENIVERARVLDLPVSKVVTAMLITTLPPSQPSPQVSTTARPEQELITWQEFKRQWQQASEAGQAGTSSDPVT